MKPDGQPQELGFIYQPDIFYDEAFDPQNRVRPHYAGIYEWLQQGGLNNME